MDLFSGLSLMQFFDLDTLSSILGLFKRVGLS